MNQIIQNKKSKERISLLGYILVLFGAQHSFAQIDSTYIGAFQEEFSTRAFLINKFVTLKHEFEADDKEIEYKPNNPLGVGIGLSWKGMGLKISYGFNFMRDPDRGKTKSFDLQSHYYGEKIVFDFFGQNYKGFYVENGKNDYTLFPNLKLAKYGLFGQYVFNGNKFSYRAAFDQSEKQIRSAGSLLLGGGAYYTKVRSDESIGFNKALYQIGPSIGYAYTWVIRQKYFVSGSFTPGVILSFENLKDKIDFNPNLFFRFASGYNSDTWSVNLSLIINGVYVSYTNNDQRSLNSGSFQLTFVKRFDSQSKILKKLPSLKKQD